jgi:hypothetical protein
MVRPLAPLALEVERLERALDRAIETEKAARTTEEREVAKLKLQKAYEEFSVATAMAIKELKTLLTESAGRCPPNWVQ